MKTTLNGENLTLWFIYYKWWNGNYKWWKTIKWGTLNWWVCHYMWCGKWTSSMANMTLHNFSSRVYKVRQSSWRNFMHVSLQIVFNYKCLYHNYLPSIIKWEDELIFHLFNIFNFSIGYNIYTFFLHHVSSPQTQISR